MKLQGKFNNEGAGIHKMCVPVVFSSCPRKRVMHGKSRILSGQKMDLIGGDTIAILLPPYFGACQIQFKIQLTEEISRRE